MHLDIQLDMDNEAFQEANGLEAARIIRDLADKILRRGVLDTDSCGVLVDVNGNKVGKWLVFEEGV